MKQQHEGELLKAYIKLSGYTQAEFGKLVGYDNRYAFATYLRHETLSDRFKAKLEAAGYEWDAILSQLPKEPEKALKEHDKKWLQAQVRKLIGKGVIKSRRDVAEDTGYLETTVYGYLNNKIAQQPTINFIRRFVQVYGQYLNEQVPYNQKGVEIPLTKGKKAYLELPEKVTAKDLTVLISYLDTERLRIEG